MTASGQISGSQTSFLQRVTRHYAVQRAAVAAATFGALILGAKTLPQSTFADVSLAMFLAKFLQLANLGSVNGYLVSYYNGEPPFSSNIRENDGLYIRGMIGHLFATALVVGALTYVAALQYLPGVLLFLSMSLIYAVEPIKRRQRAFWVSLLPDAIMAVAVFILSVVALLSGTDPPGAYKGIGVITFSVFAAVLAVIIGLFLVREYANRSVSFLLGARDWTTYLSVMRLGFPAYLSTALFTLMIGMDRLWLPVHGSKQDIAVYMLGFQLATGSLIICSSFNFINTVRIGESLTLKKAKVWMELRHMLRTSIIVAMISVAGITAAAWMLETYLLPKYENLARLTFLLALGLSAFYVSGSLTPLVMYRRRQVPLTILMGAGAVVVLGNNLIQSHIGANVHVLAIVTGSVLIAYSVYALFHVWRVARSGPNPQVDPQYSG